MKIQLASDLHLELQHNKEYLKLNPIKPIGDVLILAGDIVPFSIMEKHQDFFDYVSSNFKQTWWLPGNHEYHRSDIKDRSGTVKEQIRPNLHLVNNITIFYNNIRLLFSTLWSRIDPGFEWEIEKNINDFHLIKYNGIRLNANDYNQLHSESLEFLKNELKEKSFSKTVVITHHVPTFQNYPEEYANSNLNGAFGTELSELISGSLAECWIHGHTHFNVPEYYIGKTKILTNQLGHVEYGENKSYNSGKVVKV